MLRCLLRTRPMAAGLSPRRGIFAGQDAWRKHPMLDNCVREAFPGLGYATAIFSVYLAFSAAFAPEHYEPPHKVKGFVKEEIGEPPVRQGPARALCLGGGCPCLTPACLQRPTTKRPLAPQVAK